MNKVMIITAAFALLLLYGFSDSVKCAESADEQQSAGDKRRQSERSSSVYRIKGAIVSPDGCDEYGFIDGNLIEVGGNTLMHPVLAGQPIRTKHNIVLEILDPPSFHTAVLGPKFNTATQAQAFIKNSQTRLYLNTGWLYLTGTDVIAETQYTEAGAEGSAIAIQSVEVQGVKKHRVYFLSGESAWVKPIGAQNRHHITSANRYVDVSSDGTVGQAKEIEVEDGFVVELTKVAIAAGLQWPQPQPQPLP